MKDETGKVIFDTEEQAEVNRVVEERINRERGKYADYEDTKGILEELNAYGYQGSAKEVRQAVKTQREEFQRQQELQELQTQAKQDGTSPELLKDIKDLKAEIADLKKEKQEKVQEAQKAIEAKQAFQAKITEFEEAYPDIDINKLNEDEDFVEFLKDFNPNLSLVKAYEKYEKYVNGATNKAVAKIQSGLERSTSSGKQKGGDSTGGLTIEQRAVVDDWNKKNPKMKMSYKEYADRL